MEKKRVHYGWVVIFMGLLTTIGAHGFGRMAYTIILPSMKDGLRFDYTQLGLLGTGNFLGYLGMAVLGGFLASRFGPRLIISLALLLMGITMILTGIANSFGYAFTMRLLTGVGNGASYVPAMALGSIWFVKRMSGFATGIVTAGTGTGMVISGILVPIILKAFNNDGWRYCWFILGSIVLLLAITVWIFLRNRPEDKGLGQVGAQGEANQGQPKPMGTSSLNWKEVYGVGSVWFLGLTYFFYGISYIIYVVFYAGYLVKELGKSQAYASSLWAMVGAFSILCGMLWGWVSDRLGRAQGAFLAYLVLAAAYISYALIRNEFGIYLSSILFGLTAWSIIMAATAGDVVGARLAPAGLGFITLFFGIGQAIGPALGGYLADITKTFMWPFLTAGAISILGAVMAIQLKNYKQKKLDATM